MRKPLFALLNVKGVLAIPVLDSNLLIAAYVIVCVLLLSLNLYSRWHWIIKAATTAFVVGFFVVTYHSYSAILGWPTQRELPHQFYLHAVQVDEPENIFLWGTDLDRGMGQTVPRAYGLPYTAKLHDRVNQASRKLRKGLPVIGQIELTEGQSRETVDAERIKVAGDNLVFVDAPQALIPGK